MDRKIRDFLIENLVEQGYRINVKALEDLPMKIKQHYKNSLGVWFVIPATCLVMSRDVSHMKTHWIWAPSVDVPYFYMALYVKLKPGQWEMVRTIRVIDSDVTEGWLSVEFRIMNRIWKRRSMVSWI